MPLRALTDNETEPIRLDEAKLQVRVSSDRDDALLEDVVIPAARDRAELATQRQLLTRQWALDLDAWPCEGWIDLPRAPLQSVISITYVDTAGATQTLASSQYIVDTPSGERCQRGRVVPAYGVTWPSVRAQANAITVTFRAGYGDAPEDVPPLLRQAMLRDIASMWELREDIVVGTISSELPRSSAVIYKAFKSRARQGRAA